MRLDADYMLHALFEAGEAVRLRVSGEFDRRVDRDAYALTLYVGSTLDGFRGSVDGVALRDDGLGALHDMMRRAGDFVYHVGECRDAIRDLVDP